jgi:hypothetical protein
MLREQIRAKLPFRPPLNARPWVDKSDPLGRISGMAILKVEIREESEESLEEFPLQFGQHIRHESEGMLLVELGHWDEPTVAQEEFLEESPAVANYWVEE